MSIQVVDPATGEILMMCSDTEENKEIAIKTADLLHKRDGKQYDVIQLLTLYSTNPGEQAGHA